MSEKKPMPAAGGRYFRDKTTGSLQPADKDGKPPAPKPAVVPPTAPTAPAPAAAAAKPDKS